MGSGDTGRVRTVLWKEKHFTELSGISVFLPGDDKEDGHSKGGRKGWEGGGGGSSLESNQHSMNASIQCPRMLGRTRLGPCPRNLGTRAPGAAQPPSTPAHRWPPP